MYSFRGDDLYLTTELPVLSIDIKQAFGKLQHTSASARFLIGPRSVEGRVNCAGHALAFGHATSHDLTEPLAQGWGLVTSSEACFRTYATRCWARFTGSPLNLLTPGDDASWPAAGDTAGLVQVAAAVPCSMLTFQPGAAGVGVAIIVIVVLGVVAGIVAGIAFWKARGRTSKFDRCTRLL